MNKELPLLYYAKREIMTRLEEFRRADGSLLPERELCERIKVSRPTLREALTRLVGDGFLAKVARQGYFLTGAPARVNVGIILGGMLVPVLPAFSGIVRALENGPYWLSIIQVSRPEKLESVCEEYGLSGMVCYYLGEEYFPVMNRVARAGKLPMVAVLPFYQSPAKTLAPQVQVATYDMAGCGRERAEFFLRRGHRRIAYFGVTEKRDSYAAFKQALAAAGVKHGPELCFHDEQNLPEAAARVLERERPTALACDGGMRWLEALFQILNAHPQGRALELEIADQPGVEQLRRRYPQVKVGALTRFPDAALGVAAGERIAGLVRGEAAGEIIRLRTQLVPLL